MTRIPATIITGFLGAGKTSLLRHLVETSGRRLALVINEFGALGIDRELLLGCGIESCRAEDVVELANGCICCTVADDFLPTLQALLARAEPPEHILIETSGLALPKPLVQAFNWPEVRARVTVDGVVAVVDGAAVAAGRFADDPAALAAQRAADPALDHDNPLQEVFEDQLSAADLVILNKSDRMDAATLERVSGDLQRTLRPGVKLVPTSHGRLPAAIAIGLVAETEAHIAARPSHHDGEEDHDHDDFASFTVERGPVTDPAAFARRMEAVIAAHDVLRIKGFLDVTGRPLRGVVQAVGSRIDHGFDRPWGTGETRATRLVVIGRSGLDQAAITTALAA